MHQMHVSSLSHEGGSHTNMHSMHGVFSRLGSKYGVFSRKHASYREFYTYTLRFRLEYKFYLIQKKVKKERRDLIQILNSEHHH